MLILIILSLLSLILAVGTFVFSFSSFYVSIIIPIFIYFWIVYFFKKIHQDIEDLKQPTVYSLIGLSASLFYLTSGPESTFLIIIFSIVLLISLAFIGFMAIGPFFDKDIRKSIEEAGLLGVDKYSGSLSVQKTIAWGAILGISLNIIFSGIRPELYDSRIIDSIYMQKDSYNQNEFSSETERLIFEQIQESSSEKDRVRQYERLAQINPKKDFYNKELAFWTEKFNQVEKERIAKEKQAKEASEKAAREREERYAQTRRRDGIFSQSQALTRCKNQLRSKANSGYYMYYDEDTQRRMMTSEIDSCMYKYGYFGN